LHEARRGRDAVLRYAIGAGKLITCHDNNEDALIKE